MILKRFLIILSFILYPHISFSESEVKSYLDDIGNHCDNVEMETGLNKCIDFLNSYEEEEIKKIDVQIKKLEEKVDNLSEDEAELIFAQLDNLIETQIKIVDDITNLITEKHNMFQRATKIRQEKQEQIMMQIVKDTRKLLRQQEK